MAEVVNLRMARKTRRRADKAKSAEANRAAHGVSKGVKAASKAEDARAARLLDGMKLDRKD